MNISVLFYLILGLNIVYVARKKKNKFLTYVSIGMAIYLSYANKSSGDYNSYVNIYNNQLDYGEFGFGFLADISRSIGFSYNVFQCILCTASLIIILYVFSKFSDNYQLFFALFFISEFFINVNTIRNYVARAFLVLAIYFLLNRKKIKFLISLVFGSLFHVTMVLYLPLIFLDPLKKRDAKKLKNIGIVIGALCVLIFLGGNDFTWLYNITSKLLPSMKEKLDAYFTTSTRFGFLIYFVLHFGNLFINYKTKYHVQTVSDGNVKVDLAYKASVLLNLYTVLFFPLLMMSTSFCRSLNNIFFINVICYATILDSYEFKSRKYLKILLVIILVTLMSTFPFVHGAEQRDSILSGLI